ncbi:MAG TPA: ATP-dependent DNA helicase RecG, partial [Candidatus Nitrosotenuis sp.]|nr:ATP-dependent DNA helicase RecG [Candidatus Nitrosotenuis sp.]
APLARDPLPDWIARRQGFPPRPESLVDYHWPPSHARHEAARRRLAFEELFLLQVEVARHRQRLQSEARQMFYALHQDLLGPFLDLLPFPPTGAQRRVMAEILEDLGRPSPMNRLLQGDVGSGKTVVAAFAAWCAARSGLQAAIMAPTEILAEQHYQKLRQLLEPGGLRVGRLSGHMTRAQKRKVYAALATHELDLVVGTHALVQEGVEFARLGMVVVDEQHKFGVMQRTNLRQKGVHPDLLVMTATPIPRTLALTLYGDLEVSRLDEMPPGRQPIRSESVPFSERGRIYEEIRRELRQGRQAYIICPLIEENEKLEATAAVAEADQLRRVFPEFSVGLLHGRMKAAEKDAVMEAFRRGEHQILISTTVIEVGVDVPNATIMLVQDANRFGLAQLHQLRGRVGRGQHASRCIFMGEASSEASYRRLQAIARLSDGFEVAEEDLEIRGPGDYYGTRQAGFPELRVADLLRDQDLLEQARAAARELVERDPELVRPEHRALREHFRLLDVSVAELVH